MSHTNNDVHILLSTFQSCHNIDIDTISFFKIMVKVYYLRIYFYMSNIV